jgi:hypothetical protein
MGPKSKPAAKKTAIGDGPAMDITQESAMWQYNCTSLTLQLGNIFNIF